MVPSLEGCGRGQPSCTAREYGECCKLPPGPGAEPQKPTLFALQDSENYAKKRRPGGLLQTKVVPILFIRKEKVSTVVGRWMPQILIQLWLLRSPRNKYFPIWNTCICLFYNSWEYKFIVFTLFVFRCSAPSSLNNTGKLSFKPQYSISSSTSTRKQKKCNVITLSARKLVVYRIWRLWSYKKEVNKGLIISGNAIVATYRTISLSLIIRPLFPSLSYHLSLQILCTTNFLIENIFIYLSGIMDSIGESIIVHIIHMQSCVCMCLFIIIYPT